MPLRAHLELVLGISLPCVHEGGKVVFQFGIRGQNRENILVTAVQELDGMGERAILAVLINCRLGTQRLTALLR